MEGDEKRAKNEEMASIYCMWGVRYGETISFTYYTACVWFVCRFFTCHRVKKRSPCGRYREVHWEKSRIDATHMLAGKFRFHREEMREREKHCLSRSLALPLSEEALAFGASPVLPSPLVNTRRAQWSRDGRQKWKSTRCKVIHLLSFASLHTNFTPMFKWTSHFSILHSHS